MMAISLLLHRHWLFPSFDTMMKMKYQRFAMVMLLLVDSCSDKRLGEGDGGVFNRIFT